MDGLEAGDKAGGVADPLALVTTIDVDGDALLEHVELAPGDGVDQVAMLLLQAAEVPSPHLLERGMLQIQRGVAPRMQRDRQLAPVGAQQVVRLPGLEHLRVEPPPSTPSHREPLAGGIAPRRPPGAQHLRRHGLERTLFERCGAPLCASAL